MNDIRKGDRVAIAAHTDIFMMGERHGEVTSIGRKYIHVRGERSGRTFKFWKGGDSLESLAPPVTLNNEQELYVIRSGDGYSCLGFDVALRQATSRLNWLQGRDAMAALNIGMLPERGTLELYAKLQAINSAIYERHKATGERCEFDLCPQLVGYEGKRVEVVDSYGETRRFRVGKSTGWIPVHLEIEGMGGSPVYGFPFKSVRAI